MRDRSFLSFSASLARFLLVDNSDLIFFDGFESGDLTA